MAMKRCPVCGERYSDTYKYCPFCEEDEMAQEESQRGGASRGGRRSAAPRAASGRQPNLVTPTLVVLILFMAALLVYLLWGDKIADKFKKDDGPEDKPGVEDPIEPDKPVVKDPTVSDPDVTEPGADEPGADEPGTADPGATEPDGNMPDTPDTNTTTPPASGGVTSYEAANALPGGLTLNNTDFTRSVSEGAVQLRVSGGSGTYTWISQDPGIASVDSSGNITPISAGTTNVLVTDGSRKAVCIVRVTGSKTTTSSTTTPAPSGGTLKTGKAVVINGGNGVRVRSGPGTSHDILATIPNGGSVQVVADAGNGWYEITFSAVGGVTTTGYMKGEYLSNG